jgi:hypothetical protein
MWIKRIQFDLSIVLKDVSTKLNLFDKQFSLRGVINCIQPLKCMNMVVIMDRNTGHEQS